MYLPGRPVDTSRAVPAPTPTLTLFGPQTCYVCGRTMAKGSQGVLSRLRKAWRHSGCVVPLP